MIHKEAKLGAVTCTVIELGNGEVNLQPSYNTEMAAPILLMKTHEPRPIGETSDEWKGMTSDEYEPEVAILFLNEAGLDVLAYQIGMCRDMFKPRETEEADLAQAKAYDNLAPGYKKLAEECEAHLDTLCRCPNCTFMQIEGQVLAKGYGRLGLGPKQGETWQHYNGNLYHVLHLTNEPTPHEPESLRNLQHPPDVVYAGDNGKVWSRPLSDWHRSFTRVEGESCAQYDVYCENERQKLGEEAVEIVIKLLPPLEWGEDYDCARLEEILTELSGYRYGEKTIYKKLSGVEIMKLLEKFHKGNESLNAFDDFNLTYTPMDMVRFVNFVRGVDPNKCRHGNTTNYVNDGSLRECLDCGKIAETFNTKKP